MKFHSKITRTRRSGHPAVLSLKKIFTFLANELIVKFQQNLEGIHETSIVKKTREISENYS